MNDSDWVITSYLAANATILPITGWLSARLGRRKYFLLSIAVFTVASVLCGLATSLEQLILFRVIQGLAGGGLQPSSQGDPARRLPAREAGHGHDDVRRRGPDRPGRRPDAGRLHHGQLQLALDLPHQPPGRRPRLPDVPLRGRRPGLPQAGAGGAAVAGRSTSTTSAWGCSPWSCPAGRSCSARGRSGTGTTTRSGGSRRCSSCSSLGLGALIFRELRIANPVVNFRPLGERNLAASCIIIFCAYGVLYGASMCLPSLLQSLFGYDAFVSGLVHVALRRLLHPGDARRRRPPRPGHRRPLADRRGPARHGGRVLLDGADEPVHQPGAGGLAAGGADLSACR